MIIDWTCERPTGRTSKELAVQIKAGGRDAEPHVLILPALFDEANKMRRQTIQMMRRLGEKGIGSTLPDLPGMNESTAPLSSQTLANWRKDTEHAAQEFAATHVLTIRGGALIAPKSLPGWSYAPANGARLLRNMLRAKIVSSREAGNEETIADLSERGSKEGIELAGWKFGATLFAELQGAESDTHPSLSEIEQSSIGGAGLWLRAEPSEDTAQAESLAAVIGAGLHAA